MESCGRAREYSNGASRVIAWPGPVNSGAEIKVSRHNARSVCGYNEMVEIRGFGKERKAGLFRYHRILR